MDLAAERAAFEDAQGPVAVDAGGDFAADHHVVHSHRMGDDNVRALFDADAPGSDFTIEPPGGADFRFAVAKNLSCRAAADVGRAANGDMVVQVAEFFYGQ